MSIFTPQQYERLLTRAAVRDSLAAVQSSVAITPAARDEVRRGRRYYRLARFNDHRTSYRIAYRHDPGRETESLIVEMLRASTLKLDMSQRMSVRRPAVIDRELQRLVDSVR